MIRCRNCKAQGSDIVLQEIWAGDAMEFCQNDDGSIDTDGILLQNSDPVAVKAICTACHHGWKLRGVTQITNLVGHPDNPAFDRRAKVAR